MEKQIIGGEEWISLPQLGLPAIKVRADSGAKTSAIHAFNIQPYQQDGEEWVQFDIHPLQDNRVVTKRCKARLIDRREVKSSMGHKQQRFVIMTTLRIGEQEWPIEVTLTNRDAMGYRMLLGRQAMTGRLVVDPSLSCVHAHITPTQLDSYYKKDKRQKTGLNIVLLGSNPELYSNRRLMEAGEQRGHHMQFINVKYCYMNIGGATPEIHYRGETLQHVDAIIPRLRPSMTFYGCAVTRQFETASVFTLNNANAIAHSRDKLRSLQLLADADIRMPLTGFAHSPQDTKDLIKMVGGAPLIIKLLEGTQGVGVVLAETNKASESVINAFKSLKAHILVQEFVKEAQGRDIRCFVIGNKVVGAMERQAAEGEFRANLHLGGVARAIKITAEERRIAVRAAKAMGLHVAGVDIIRSSSGPKVLEVNSSPGLEGIEEASGKDIASLMIQHIEKHVHIG